MKDPPPSSGGERGEANALQDALIEEGRDLFSGNALEEV